MKRYRRSIQGPRLKRSYAYSRATWAAWARRMLAAKGGYANTNRCPVAIMNECRAAKRKLGRSLTPRDRAEIFARYYRDNPMPVSTHTDK